MPKTSKVLVKKKKIRKKTSVGSNGIAGRIQPVADLDDGFKLLIYGHSKMGKTRLACSFPKPLLLIGAAGIGTEKGTRSVSNVKGVDFIGLESSTELEELASLERYATFVLDTAGGLQERVVNEFTNHEPTATKDWRHVGKGSWGSINSQTVKAMRWLLNAADFRGKHVVIIAHERAFNVDNESDIVFPHVGAALTPGVSGWLDGASDYIGQCFIRERVKVSTMSIGGKDVNQEVGTGKMEYCLRVGAHPVYRTGFRIPVGGTLPDAIVDPDYSKILKLIEGV